MIQRFGKFYYRLYKVFMKTLTINDAKKNLGRWLTAGAGRGYRHRLRLRYRRAQEGRGGVHRLRATRIRRSPRAGGLLEKATDQHYRRLKRGKKLTSITAAELRKMFE
jgi:hypothetical protein